MIGKLIGKIEALHANMVLINVANVVYEVFCSQICLRQLTVNSEAELFISTQMKENSIELFGFQDIESKELFLLLQSVNGVGAKMSIGFLDTFSQEEIKNIILTKQDGLLSKIPGVGKKLSQRIILELHEKVKKMPCYIHNTQIKELNHSVQDAVAVLTKLGLSHSEAKNKINSLSIPINTLSIEEIVKAVLQNSASINNITI